MARRHTARAPTLTTRSPESKRGPSAVRFLPVGAGRASRFSSSRVEHVRGGGQTTVYLFIVADPGRWLEPRTLRLAQRFGGGFALGVDAVEIRSELARIHIFDGP